MNKKKILVLDDEPEIVEFIEKVLTKNGYDVSSSTNPLEVLEKIKSGEYELLITDIKMPEMSGIELIKKVRMLNLSKPLEIVVITAHATVDTAIECMRAGAADYLIKPFEIKEILVTVEKVLNNQQLKSRLVSMEEMGKLKDDFIATATHELKTPLMAIQGASELLGMIEKEEGGSLNSYKEEVKRFSDIVSRQTDKMKKLIDDLLDSARIDAKRLLLNKTEVNLDILVKETISEIQPFADSKKIAINYSSSNKEIIIRCDYHQIKRVLNNIIVNALKYTPVGGKVDVDIAVSTPDKNNIMVTVSDNGVGIKEEDIEKIFEKFYRVNYEDVKGSSGSFGLGLFIARKIIELHHGKIWAESEGPGKGTKIIFTLPIGEE